MFEALKGRRGKRTSSQTKPWRREGHPVRLALLTWPVVVLLGATFAAAACLLTDCKQCGQALAHTTLVGSTGSVKSIAFRPDGAMLSSVGVDGSLLVWDMAKRPESAFIPRGVGVVRCAAFSPDNRLLATANANGTVSFYDTALDESRVLDNTPAATPGATCVAFAGDGATLAVGQGDGKIALWDTDTGRKRLTLNSHGEGIISLAFSPDCIMMASSGLDQVTRIWDLPTRRERYAITCKTNTYVSLTFSPDGRLLVLGDHVSPVVRIWDMTTGIERATLRGPAGIIVGVAISPDGTTIAAADFQGSVTFWDMTTLKVRPGPLRNVGVHSLAFAPNGRALAGGASMAGSISGPVPLVQAIDDRFADATNPRNHLSKAWMTAKSIRAP